MQVDILILNYLLNSRRVQEEDRFFSHRPRGKDAKNGNLEKFERKIDSSR
jgi:hypothetical protein